MTELDAAIATENTILRGVVGSTAYGLAIEGEDDRDELGVFIEPPERVCGLTPLDHYVQRDRPNGVRSEPGDLDLTLYSLRKFTRLALKGNPSVLQLLWLPRYEVFESVGRDLIRLRTAFLGQPVGAAFLGYLVSQRRRLTGERARTVTRPELIARYGYDTKFAMHALRLGYQGLELLRYGRITIPIPEPERTILRAIRIGEIGYVDALDRITRAEADLAQLSAGYAGKPDHAAVDEFLVAAHTRWWRC